MVATFEQNFGALRDFVEEYLKEDQSRQREQLCQVKGRDSKEIKEAGAKEGRRVKVEKVRSCNQRD